MAKAGGFFFVVFGITALMRRVAHDQPGLAVRPVQPAQVTAGSQPDWYIGFLEGSLRMMPSWETHFCGHTTQLEHPASRPADPARHHVHAGRRSTRSSRRWVTGDKREHHLLDRPRNAPTRTGYRRRLHHLLRPALDRWWQRHHRHALRPVDQRDHLVPPDRGLRRPGARVLGHQAHLPRLQRADRDRLLHGRETGVIVRSPEGKYTERHEPIGTYESYTLTARDRLLPLDIGPETDDNGVRAPRRALNKLRAQLSRFYFADAVQKPTREELEEGHEHAHDSDEIHDLSETETYREVTSDRS